MNYQLNFHEYSYDELLDAEKHIDQAIYPERYAMVIKLLSDPHHLTQNKTQIAEKEIISKYSTFWPRFLAAFIDGLILITVLYVESLLFGFEYNQQDNLLLAFNGFQLVIYTIIMHGLCNGQTFGKMFLGVKVLNHGDELPIDILQAFRRESVNFVLNIISIILLLVITTIETLETLMLILSINAIFNIIVISWALSEFITMLFNDKRRALHDYIGKTVVVRL